MRWRRWRWRWRWWLVWMWLRLLRMRMGLWLRMGMRVWLRLRIWLRMWVWLRVWLSLRHRRCPGLCGPAGQDQEPGLAAVCHIPGAEGRSAAFRAGSQVEHEPQLPEPERGQQLLVGQQGALQRRRHVFLLERS